MTESIEVKYYSEEHFLRMGEPDPEFEHILHFGGQIFDYITKDVGLELHAENFCDAHHYLDMRQEDYDFIIESIIANMKKRKNKNYQLINRG